MFKYPTASKDSKITGFTLTELIVLLAVLAIGSIIILPAFARTKTNTSAAVCLNNLRQLSSAWTMYSSENAEMLVWSYPDISCSFGYPSWCLDNAAASSPGSYCYSGTDTNGLTRGRLWPYVKSISAYKCGADERVASTTGGVKPILRSYSINGYLAGSTYGDPSGTSSVIYNAPTTQTTVFRLYVKSSELRYPAKTFVFADEDGISINDGMLLVDMGAAAKGLVDLPGRQHDGGYGVNFADGHAMIMKLVTQQALTATTLPVSGYSNLDYQNLTNMTTFPQ